LFSQEEGIIKKLFFKEEGKKELFDHDVVLEHFGIQDYTTVTDFLNKVGKSWKIFGKGGKIDISRVRNKILNEWYNGKLTHLLHN
jgi:ribosome biogenesis GTPase A